MTGKTNGTAVVTTRQFCGASTRQARQGRPKGSGCKHPAGFRTDHPGIGRCWMHGGRSPVKHGRYSKIKTETVRQLIEDHAADPDPLDILPELAATRALFQDFIERYAEWRAALVAWHASYNENYQKDYFRWLQARGDQCSQCNGKGYVGSEGSVAPERPDPAQYPEKPRNILDISEAYKMASEATKIVERIEAMRNKDVVSRADLARVLSEMWKAVDLLVNDDAAKTRIREAWLAVAL